MPSIWVPWTIVGKWLDLYIGHAKKPQKNTSPQATLPKRRPRPPHPNGPTPKEHSLKRKIFNGCTDLQVCHFCQAFSPHILWQGWHFGRFFGFKDSTKKCQKSWLWSWSISSTWWLNQNMLVKLDQNKHNIWNHHLVIYEWSDSVHPNIARWMQWINPWRAVQQQHTQI